MNTKYIATGDKIIAHLLPEEEHKTSSGLIIVSHQHNPVCRYEVLSIGPEVTDPNLVQGVVIMAYKETGGWKIDDSTRSMRYSEILAVEAQS